MLTPIFSLSQDDDFIHLRIRAPHASIKECDVQFEDRHFTFYAQPYFLRLYLPNQVVQDGRELVTWDSDECQFRIQVPKLNPREHFEDLDMLTKLLTKPGKAGSLIEVVNSASFESLDDEFDWTIEQTLVDEGVAKYLSGNSYGFANSKLGIFERLNDEILLAIDLKEPARKTILQRRAERMADEALNFDDDHYLTSLHEDCNEIDKLIQWIAPWDEIDSYGLCDDEKFRLKNLPKKEYLLDRGENMRVLLGLVDLLFAFAYDVRTTEGDHTSESNWTIYKLSATLSWLETFDNLKETLITCMRRSLCFPYHRNWRLSIKVIEDVQRILKTGKKCTLKCLLKIHELLNRTVDLRYILNDLYITDYCVWIQTVCDKSLNNLGESIKQAVTEISKEDVGLDIVLLEKAAEETLKEDELRKLTSNMSCVEIK